MKLAAITLPILMAFAICQPAQARDFSQPSQNFERLYPYGQPKALHHKQTKSKAERERSPAANWNKQKPAGKKLSQKPQTKKVIIKKTFVQNAKPHNPPKHASNKWHQQRVYSPRTLMKIVRKRGYYDIHNYSNHGGRIASLDARSRNGSTYRLQIDIFTGQILDKRPLFRARLTYRDYRSDLRRPSDHRYDIYRPYYRDLGHQGLYRSN
nr:hypothetical protein [uncultured Cohaesibacter sp.]